MTEPSTQPRRVNVLVFPCGSEIGTEIHQALRYSLHVRLFGASSVDDHGAFRYDRYRGDLPNIADARFDEAFAALLSEWSIDLVFATHDSVQEHLSGTLAALGVALVNGDRETSAVLRRKSRTYRQFSGAAWMPAVYDDLDAVDQWPVVIKPDRGQGG
ncbi:MAG TPA: hypothetical protein VGX37_03900, partial [Allosphingosinicella sp.]|nr:hypothetical protein [Allosphingosinicella sp.]